MSGRRRLAILAVLVVALAVATGIGASGVAVGQADNATATEYSIEELRRGGIHPSEAPDSIRLLGEPTRGSISLRYQPANPVKSSEEFLEPGTRLQTDRIRLVTTAFGEVTGNYTLVLIYWQPGTVPGPNGTERTVARNVTVDRETFTVGEGYDSAEIELRSHYEDTWEVTAYLTRGGEPVEGARWRFEHASVAATQPVTGIETEQDLWGWAFWNVIGPGAGGIVIGLVASRRTLRRTGTGPRMGLGMWAILFAIVLGGLVTAAYYQIAAVLANLPPIMGLSLGLLAYGGGLVFASDVERIQFVRQELTDAAPMRNYDQAVADRAEDDDQDLRIAPEEYREELYQDQPTKPTVKQDGIRRLPKRGVFPFLARLFASAARLDLSQLRTRVLVEDGRNSEVVYVDPEQEEAIEHTPARLRTRMPGLHRLSAEPTRGEIITTLAVTTVLVAGIPWLGWQVAGAAINAPSVGLVVGFLPALVDSFEAVDGCADFEPAAIHDRAALATLTVLQREHADAKTIEEYEEIAWTERLRTEQEAREVERRRDRTLIEQGHDRTVKPARERQENGRGDSDE